MTADTDNRAAEYVLGTLPAEERVEFEALLTASEAARQAVADWEQRLAPLGNQVEGVTPPPAVWNAIERALGRPATMPQAVGTASIHVLRRSRDRWRAATYLAGALAAGLVLFSVDRLLVPSEENASYVAVVDRGGDQPALIIRVDLATHTVFVRPVATEVPQGHSLELWYIGQGKTPKSMGLVDHAPKEVPLPSGASIEKANFAVTVEPQGGSPTGSPTGPIVYSGQLLKE
jgi:anti-sigma-K factor RskA